MAAGSIGGISIDIIRGLPQTLKQRMDVWQVPGVNGYGAMLLGLGDAEFEIVTANYFTTTSDATAFVQSCELLQGQIVSVIDNFALELDGVLVVHVDTLGALQRVIYQGSTDAARVQINWRMIAAVPGA